MKKETIKKLPHIFTSRAFAYFLIIFGVILRLNHYLENRSLWLDESWIAVRIVSRSFKEIISAFPVFPNFRELPLGFQLLCKSATVILGNTEWALRFFPFISAIVSVLVFYYYLKKYCPKEVTPIALGLFALCDSLVYFSAELKPYSVAVLLSLILLLIFEKLRKENIGLRNGLFTIFIGMSVPWFSHSCIFVLMSVAVLLIGLFLIQKQWDKLKIFSLISLSWLCSCGIVYNLYLSSFVTEPKLKEMWKDGLMPGSLVSVQSLIWLKTVVINFFNSPLGHSPAIISFVLFAVGCLRLWRKDKGRCFIVLVPFLMTLFAAVFQIYPFQGRVVLFLIPFAILGISEGLNVLITHRSRILVFAGVLCLAIVTSKPVKTAAYYIQHKRCTEENREMIRTLGEYYQKGDFLVLNDSAQYSFLYYVSQLRLDQNLPADGKLIDAFSGAKTYGSMIGKFTDETGRDLIGEFAELSLEMLVFDSQGHYRRTMVPREGEVIIRVYQETRLAFPNKRVWLVLSHVKPEPREFLIETFDASRARKEEFNFKGASLVLYERNKDNNFTQSK